MEEGTSGKTVGQSVADEVLMNKIYVFREQKVMLDSDLADLYGVETRRLNEQVRRNPTRFPKDFMFELTQNEWEILKSQNATSSWGGKRKEPKVFTEHGVLMLSSVLNSEQAIQVNIQIMRVFSKIRQMVSDNTRVLHELADMRFSVDKMSRKQLGQDKSIELIFEYIDRLQEKLESPTPTERKQIGYKIGGEDKGD